MFIEKPCNAGFIITPSPIIMWEGVWDYLVLDEFVKGEKAEPPPTIKNWGYNITSLRRSGFVRIRIIFNQFNNRGTNYHNISYWKFKETSRKFLKYMYITLDLDW